jgi:hypothetical protein
VAAHNSKALHLESAFISAGRPCRPFTVVRRLAT